MKPLGRTGRVWMLNAGWGGAVCAALACMLGGCRTSPPGRAHRDPLTSLQPPRFIRYWAPFVRTDLQGAYTSVTIRNGLVEVWHAVALDAAAAGDDRSPEVEALAVRRGSSVAALGPAETVLVMRDLIDDVPRLDGQPGLAPKRAFSRTYVMHDEEAGYVGLVCSYPEYGRYLHPALIASPTGAPGTWRYLGKLKGEPADEIATGRRVWSDGGTLLRLPDRRWRIYTNGYGEWNGLVALEADSLAGPWRFLRHADGRIRMLTPNIPTAGQGLGIFPNVLRVRDAEWHLWMSDRWIPDAVWHFSSTDGLTWTIYGRQPEIVRAETEDYIKCMRSFVAPDGKHIVGLLSVALNDPAAGDQAPWVMCWSRLPLGVSP